MTALFQVLNAIFLREVLKSFFTTQIKPPNHRFLSSYDLLKSSLLFNL
ncbi:hypothetical protein HPSA20_0181 [Helicobacter pylori SouthAfrica20]|uniref:Uncharacterized protein n=1 Tax=Helicobacter pylori SouthAfrica20 TaxID=1352356 RepID=T1U893_HELPX|nr:hypothetical protein HPSA20_0181 [Helicobacter pylori SouthAfrica20]